MQAPAPLSSASNELIIGSYSFPTDDLAPAFSFLNAHPERTEEPQTRLEIMDFALRGTDKEIFHARTILKDIFPHLFPSLALREMGAPLSKDNVLNILEASLDKGARELTAECLKYIAEQDLTLLSSRKETQDLLNTLERLRFHGGVLTSPNPSSSLSIFTIRYTKEFLKDTATLFKHADLGLFVRLESCDEKDLSDLMNQIPKLTYLRIEGNDKITTVPRVEDISILELECCDGLTSIEAPNTTKLTITQCLYMASVSAPKAHEIDISASRCLTALSAPNATKVCLYDCPLTSLSAPNATSVEVIDCYNLPLENIQAPETCAIKILND